MRWSFHSHNYLIKHWAYTMNTHLDDDEDGDTLQPLMVKALRTKVWDFAQVNSCFKDSGPNLEATKRGKDAILQNSPTKIQDMDCKGSK